MVRAFGDDNNPSMGLKFFFASIHNLLHLIKSDPINVVFPVPACIPNISCKTSFSLPSKTNIKIYKANMHIYRSRSFEIPFLCNQVRKHA